MFNKILIANRGEIACRIIKTAMQLGIKTVAVYSEADSNALHTKMADEAYCIGPASSQESYLCIDKIISVAKQTSTQAIHPGYGFLSENAVFAKACADNNIVFIGPNIEAIEAMGSKSTAKHIMQEAKVPLVPGYHGEDQDEKLLLAEAKKIGFPVMLKATAGGGGKGMRAVHSETEFTAALDSAKREALSSFNDNKMLVEKYITAPRHIEVQVFADNHGNVVHLYERDCSIQRRHQKIIEEAPAFNFPDETRDKITHAAIQAAKAIKYRGAGTVEFLYDEDGSFYFMEMNTRLQVEHPVTEMITGLDLVHWQLLVAANQTLPLEQAHISCNGHALEVRIYAEDAENNFLPSIGTIEYLHAPEACRIDSGIFQNSTITPYYDPMVAKLIVHAESRQQCIAKLQQALQHYFIVGIKTNIEFLLRLIELDDFINFNIDTNFIAEHEAELYGQTKKTADEVYIFAALFYLQQHLKFKKHVTLEQLNSPWTDNDGWRMNYQGQQKLNFTVNGETQDIDISFNKSNYSIKINSKQYSITAEIHGNNVVLLLNQQRCKANVIQKHDDFTVFYKGQQHKLELFNPLSAYESNTVSTHSMCAPMPGTVVAIYAQTGTDVKSGENLMVLEAMKMEHTIQAASDGTIKEILYAIGDMVEEGSELVRFEEEEKL